MVCCGIRKFMIHVFIIRIELSFTPSSLRTTLLVSLSVMKRMQRDSKRRWMTERVMPAKVPRKLPFKRWVMSRNNKVAVLQMENLTVDSDSEVCYLDSGILRRQQFPKHCHSRHCHIRLYRLQNQPIWLHQARNAELDHL